ncbi:MAG: glycosyltransferase family 4 protein [Candidatus Sungbacteria bacterium]|nr:glycosyltransferase family 4 protein [bacterium]MDZ4260203.1 glycosyltransferase family 4 protein [Candidatus Sungbacteria bacterium]
MTRKKIVVFTTSYLPFIGGAEIAIQESSRRLSAVFDFFIITARNRRDLPAWEVVPEGVVIRVGFGNRFDKWLLPLCGFFAVLKLVLRGSIELPYKRSRVCSTLFWGMDISQGSMSAWLLKIIFPRTPFVFTVQYGYGDSRLAHGRGGFIGAAFRRMLTSADYATAISSYLFDTMIHYGYIGSAKIIPNGVDTNVFAYKSDADVAGRRESNQRVIITTSRLVQKNGIDMLIRAIAEVKQAIPSIKCYIIGDGPERGVLEKLTRELGLIRDIIFLGNIPYKEIPFYLKKADLFVRASRSEGMGNSFVEALSVGIPVIGTAVGGIPDIIIDNETGIFCRKDDAHDCAQKILHVLNDTPLVAHMREKGRRLVEEKFSWDAVASSYRGIFDSLFALRGRVLIATPLYPPEIGGPATYSKLLVDNFLNMGVLTRLVRFSDVRKKPKILRHIAYALKVAWTSRYADIVYAQDPVSVGFPAALAAMVMRKKFIVKIVGDYAWEQGVQRFQVTDFLDDFLKKSYGIRVQLLRGVERFTARHAMQIVVPSHYLKHVVSQWGIKEKKIVVIPNAFELPLGQSDTNVRAMCPGKGPLIVSAGRLVPWKGFETLIDAAAEYMQYHHDVSLIIIGSGPLEAMLREKIRVRGMESHIQLIGNVSHEEMLRLLACADTFVLNTGYEGFSHALLEAMAMGTPVITTRVGGNSELITPGENGFLIEFNNQLQLSQSIDYVLQMTHNDRERIIVRAKQTAGQFTKARMLQHTAELLMSL